MSEDLNSTGGQTTGLHTVADVESAIGALDQEGWRRLRTAARNSVRRFRLDALLRDLEDLLSEAVTRMLSGRRSWPRGIGFEFQVARTMDSIASDWRRREASDPEIREVELYSPDDADDEDAAAGARFVRNRDSRASA